MSQESVAAQAAQFWELLQRAQTVGTERAIDSLREGSGTGVFGR